MLTLKEFVLASDRFVVAHRGSSGTAPENTMSAYREAIEVGAMMIETDVQLTSDDYVITFHDGELSRTTNGSGLPGEMKYEELAKLDAGSWFDSKFSGEKIPQLAELIALVKGKAYLNIEIKSRKSSLVGSRMDNILNVIYESKYQNYTLLTSFDHRLIAELKKADASLHTGIINIPGDKRLPSEILEGLEANAFVCSLDEINEAKSEDARRNGIIVGVYSIDIEKQLEIVSRYHVQAIVTNYPGRIINLMKRN